MAGEEGGLDFDEFFGCFKLRELRFRGLLFRDPPSSPLSLLSLLLQFLREEVEGREEERVEV